MERIQKLTPKAKQEKVWIKAHLNSEQWVKIVSLYLAQGLESLDRPLTGIMLTPSSTVKFGLVVDGTLVSIRVASTVFFLTVTWVDKIDKRDKSIFLTINKPLSLSLSLHIGCWLESDSIKDYLHLLAGLRKWNHSTIALVLAERQPYQPAGSLQEVAHDGNV